MPVSFFGDGYVPVAVADTGFVTVTISLVEEIFMKKYFIVAFTFSLLTLGAGASFAEWFDGEVQKIDAKARTITISEIDPITETEEKEEILVTDATLFTGVKSLTDIRANDNVTVEAQYDELTDVWKAVSVEVPEAGA